MTKQTTLTHEDLVARIEQSYQIDPFSPNPGPRFNIIEIVTELSRHLNAAVRSRMDDDPELTQAARIANTYDTALSAERGDSQEVFAREIIDTFGAHAHTLYSAQDSQGEKTGAELFAEENQQDSAAVQQLFDAARSRFQQVLTPKVRYAAHLAALSNQDIGESLKLTRETVNDARQKAGANLSSISIPEAVTLSDVLQTCAEYDQEVRALSENPTEQNLIPLGLTQRYFLELFKALDAVEGRLSAEQEITLIDQTIASAEIPQLYQERISPDEMKEAVFMHRWGDHVAATNASTTLNARLVPINYTDGEALGVLGAVSMSFCRLKDLDHSAEDFFIAVNEYGNTARSSARKFGDTNIVVPAALNTVKSSYVSTVLGALKLANKEDQSTANMMYSKLALAGVSPDILTDDIAPQFFAGVDTSELNELSSEITPYASFVEESVYDVQDTFQEATKKQLRILETQLLRENQMTT